jgi:MFS family permease
MRQLGEQKTRGDQRPPSETSQRGLDWFAFFLADVQVGFGPFLSIYLTTHKWTNADIGIVLSIGSIIGLLGQVPGGALIDALRHDKLVATSAMIAIGISALWIGLSPQFLSVVLAQTLHVSASVIIGPALAAISLGLVGYGLIGERLGRNARFASCGSIAAGAFMGFVGQVFSSQAVFYVTAMMAIPAVLALRSISAEDLRAGHRHDPPDEPHEVLPALLALLHERSLIILAACVFFFHLANAAVLPIVASTITMRVGEQATFMIALAMIVPQIMVALASPHVGRFADRHGRRRLLMLGFAVLPVRTVLLSSTTEPVALVAIQILDGISATCLGVLVATCVADIVRGHGHFNLALGVVGTAMGIGAAISTTLAGIVADKYGSSTALLMLSVIALCGFVLCALLLPETKSSISSKDQGGCDETKH